MSENAVLSRRLDGSAKARLHLAEVLDLAGYREDAEHLRKPVRIGDVIIPHSVAIAAMLSFARNPA